MSTAYWTQWDYSEVIDVHSMSYRNCCDEDAEDQQREAVKHEFDTNQCPECSGNGCNYCLMCEW